jgi:hypothetical protein
MNVEAATDLVHAVTARLKDEPQKVWVLRTETRHGDSLDVFATEATAREAAIEQLDDWRANYGGMADVNPFDEQLERLTSGQFSAGSGGDWVVIESHIVRS